MKPNETAEQSVAWREALAATSLGWDLALPIFGGVILGYLLDRRLGTQYTFTLGLLVLGIFTGFYNVFRSVQRIEARERRHAHEIDEASATE
jgi:predicted F0F1-ATPase subunit